MLKWFTLTTICNALYLALFAGEKQFLLDISASHPAGRSPYGILQQLTDSLPHPVLLLVV